ncbi:monoheme cytochrome C [Muricauda sp. JGD-17]|uniref:Monoheme cytochrome C n=1 Tax=Flagellimonas ochracea TaxID=2696472 RepID=A0A964TC45_9FLAO|nr:monoheme cytochrome C [Allomuricauda ochracea]NAY90781.1 monoheme cytochrome C [Allomuricauda ochracea]
MDNSENVRKAIKQVSRLMAVIFMAFVIIAGMLVYLMVDPTLSAFKSAPSTEEYVSVQESSEEQLSEEDFDKIENGIHVRTGLLEAEGLMEVVNNCTNCHSAKLVTQNRMNKERWIATIRWMQETQNLWDLGNNEEIIVNYLVTNYPVKKKGRREILSNIEWYELQE